MNKIYNILVFPGGNEVGMEIYKSLVDSQYVQLFSVSSRIVNHASYLYKNHFEIDDIFSETWIDQLNQIIEREKIDFIFPAHAFIIDALAQHRTEIIAPLMLCSDDALYVTRSKRRTYEYFEGILPVPKTYRNLEEVSNYPVFTKPDNFYGSQGAEKAESEDQLKVILSQNDDLVISEYLDGEEYTVDCFSDKNGELLFCEGRTRQRIRMGTSMHCERVSSENDSFFRDAAQKILEKLKIVGPWFFQMKKDHSGSLKLLEIEPRVAGTMAFHRVKGINFPLLFLYTMLGFDVEILNNEFDYTIDRALVNRYNHKLKYDTVYVDLDDTIVIHDKLNISMIRFLYQCVNDGKQIVLISKSLEGDKVAYLKKWKIENLFDEIIWLNESDSKADYINTDFKPIFIDDSFSQRLEVSQKLNISTFDPSMIELLLDERK